MKNSSNKPDQAKDGKRINQENRIGTIRPGNAAFDETGQSSEMNPRTSGSNEMATGSPVTSGEQRQPRSTKETPAQQSKMPASGKNSSPEDAEGVRRLVREDVKADTGEATGSIHGRDGNINFVSDRPDEKKEESH